MALLQSELYYHEDSGACLGKISRDETSWLAQTEFGYTLARTTSKVEAESVLQERGLSALKGVWQYYDTDDRDWFPCVIQEANENKVVVARTNEAGVQGPKTYKHVVVVGPSEENFMKLS